MAGAAGGVGVVGLTPAALAAFVEASCSRHGVPVKVSDAVIVGRVVVLLGGGAPDGGRQPAAVVPSRSEPPDGIDSGRVKAPRSLCAWRNDDVIEHSGDDRVLPGEVQAFPLGA